jgi:hypothetical protein
VIVQIAKSEFEKAFKLMNNACFGESKENVRNRRTIEIVGDPAKLKKVIAKPQTEQFLIINTDMIFVDRIRSFDKQTNLHRINRCGRTEITDF